MFRLSFCCAPLCAFLFASNAWAQTPVVVPEVVVDAPGGSLTVPSVVEQREAIEKTAGAVTFVDSESFANRYTNNLRDVLRDVPGVLTQERYGQELRVSVRGSGISRAFHTRGVEILQDGVPFNNPDGSGDYYQIDPLALRSIEVFKGGNGLTVGSTYLGGAINFVTPTARTAIAPNVLRAEGGSFGTVRGQAQASRIWENVDVFGNLTVSHSDGYRDHSRQQYEHFNGNVGVAFAPGVETRFFLGVFDTKQKLPGSVTLPNVFTNPRAASAAALAGDQARNVEAQRLVNRTTFALDSGKIDFDVWAMHKNLYHPIFQVIDQDGWFFGAAPRYTGAFTVAGFRNELIAGARYYGGVNDARQYVNISGQRGAQTLNARQDADNYDVFAENRFFFLPTMALMTGAKVFQSERRYADFGGLPANPLAKADSVTYSGVNPKLGLIWFPSPNVQVFADITRSADVPDFTDLNQTIGATRRFVPLSEQKGVTVELGTRGRLENATWDVTLYRSKIEDELLQFVTNPSIPAATFNAPRTIHQGVELAGSVDILRSIAGLGVADRLTLAQVWTYSDFRFDDDPQYRNNRIAGVPRHVLRSSLTYHHASGFYIGPQLDIVPEGAFVDFANTLRVPSYTLLGMQTGFQMNNGWLIFLEGRNLADRRYVADFGTVTDARTATTAVFYPGTGRAIYGGVRYAM